jgi:hypothetical protein
MVAGGVNTKVGWNRLVGVAKNCWRVLLLDNMFMEV